MDVSSKEPFDLFHQPQKKSRPAAKPKPSSPLPSDIQEEKKQESSDLSSSDVREIMEKAAKMHDELEQKLEETYQKTGWQRQAIKQFLENPNNFSKSEWELVQRQRDYLVNQTWSLITEEEKTRLLHEEKKKQSQVNKGKSLGARKNWIPIR